jgi:hypothetical protein
MSYLPNYVFIYLLTYYLFSYLVSYLPTNLFMKKTKVQMLLYTLTKKFMKIQRNMLNAFGIILFYKVIGWFDGQH